MRSPAASSGTTVSLSTISTPCCSAWAVRSAFSPTSRGTARWATRSSVRSPSPPPCSRSGRPREAGSSAESSGSRTGLRIGRPGERFPRPLFFHIVKESALRRAERTGSGRGRDAVAAGADHVQVEELDGPYVRIALPGDILKRIGERKVDDGLALGAMEMGVGRELGLEARRRVAVRADLANKSLILKKIQVPVVRPHTDVS